MKRLMLVLCTMLLLLQLGCMKKQVLKNDWAPSTEVSASTSSTECSKYKYVNVNRVPECVSLFFDFDSSKVSAESKTTLGEAFQDTSNKFKEEVRIVSGHCDERGSEAYNLCLGQKRAEAVKEYLKFLGVTNVRTISYGSNKPKCAGHDEASWKFNRRVDIMILQ